MSDWLNDWENEQDDREPRRPATPQNPLAKFTWSELINEIYRRLKQADVELWKIDSFPHLKPPNSDRNRTVLPETRDQNMREFGVFGVV